jgi:hypothetical protein
LSALDRVLAGVEVVLVAASLFALAIACVAPSRARVRRATVAAAIAALTVAQPFGVVTERQRGTVPPGATRSSPDGVHTLRVFGFLPVPYVLYRRDRVWASDTSPHSDARARSWLWAPVLTNASEIAGICASNVFVPCWSSSGFGSENLQIAEDGGETWAVFRNPDSRLHPPGQVPRAFAWKLGFGLASPAGLVYWAVALGLVMVARARLRADRPT